MIHCSVHRRALHLLLLPTGRLLQWIHRHPWKVVSGNDLIFQGSASFRHLRTKINKVLLDCSWYCVYLPVGVWLTGLWGGMLPPEEIWSSPHQPTGSDSVRHGAGGAIFPAGTSTTLRRLLSGPLTSTSSDRDNANSFYFVGGGCEEGFISTGSTVQISFSEVLICYFIWIQSIPCQWSRPALEIWIIKSNPLRPSWTVFTHF